MSPTAFRRSAVLPALVMVLLTPPLSGASTWREASFEDFRDGSFLDAGSNLYVSAAGRIQMINRWDFNGDGHLDILLPTGHAHTEKENIYIYLNSGRDVEGRMRIDLPGSGTEGGVIADFDQDGFNDLAVVNNADSHFRRVDAWVYYGSAEGMGAGNRAELPAFRGSSIAGGDFNGDGWTDLALACRWQDGTKENPIGPEVSLIYWNSKDGFSKDDRLELVFEEGNATDVAAGDLDGDGRADLVAVTGKATHVYLSTRGAFGSGEASLTLAAGGQSVALGDHDGDGVLDIASGGHSDVKVFYSRNATYSLEDAVVLGVDFPRDLAAADVDGDGVDDLIVASFAMPGGATWTDSCIFYADGGDFSTREPVKLPTLGAAGVSTGDLNGDGLPEVVFSNQRVVNQNHLFSYIFWNESGTFHEANRTYLRTAGSLDNVVGDVDNDGDNDIIIFNDEGGFRDGPGETHIYWGDGARNFSVERRTAFLGHHVFGQGHADLDDDGNVDIVLCQQQFYAGVDHHQSGLQIFWGDHGDFSRETGISLDQAYGGVRIADINRDGYLDILSGGGAIDPNDRSRRGIPILWGSKDGYQHFNRSVIANDTRRVRGPLLADLNNDGWLDVAAQEEWDKVKIRLGSEKGFPDEPSSVIRLGREIQFMYLKAADLNQDGWLDILLPQRGPPEGTEKRSFVYYGSADGFSDERYEELRSYVPYQNSIADFDRDGWLDVFLTSYGGEVSGNRPALLYWGTADGFAKRPRLELETFGSSGSEAADYDGDGWLDLFISNHRKSGSIYEPRPHRHVTHSLLYWGGPDGFSRTRRWEIPAGGPSGLSLRDVGNMHDRGLYEDYVSSPHEIASGVPASIRWEAETPHGTGVSFQLRMAETKEKLSEAAWRGPRRADSWYTRSGERVRGVSGKWIQYRARLRTPNGGPTPYLTAVEIEFR